MAKDLKISVVIPAYNAELTLSAAIDSCLKQTYKPHEIIVIDDAGTDNTAAIAESYSQIQLIKQPINSGPSAARNKGWDSATGDIIAFLDADDIFHPEKLAVLNNVFSTNSNIVLLGHPYTLDELQELRTTNPGVETKSYTSILLSNPYQSSCIVVRKDYNERFNETYRYCEDHEFCLRTAYRKGCHYIKLPLTKLGRPQLSSGGASGNIWKMRKGELRLYTSVYRHNILFALLIPFLIVYSLLKMSRKILS